MRSYAHAGHHAVGLCAVGDSWAASRARALSNLLKCGSIPVCAPDLKPPQAALHAKQRHVRRHQRRARRRAAQARAGRSAAPARMQGARRRQRCRRRMPAGGGGRPQARGCRAAHTSRRGLLPGAAPASADAPTTLICGSLCSWGTFGMGLPTGGAAGEVCMFIPPAHHPKSPLPLVFQSTRQREPITTLILYLLYTLTAMRLTQAVALVACLGERGVRGLPRRSNSASTLHACRRCLVSCSSRAGGPFQARSLVGRLVQCSARPRGYPQPRTRAHLTRTQTCFPLAQWRGRRRRPR